MKIILFVALWSSLLIDVPTCWAKPVRPDIGEQSDVGIDHSEHLRATIGVILGCGALLSLILVALGCLCCQRGVFKTFEGFHNGRLHHGYDNRAATNEFTMFPPSSGSQHRGSMADIKFEPLPDIRPRGRNVSTIQRPRPATFSNVINRGLSVQDWFEDPHANFPRFQLQYLQELGSGWFGKVVEGEAQGIGNNPKKTKVVVKILREDATPTDQMYFLHEVKPFRDLNHPNIMKLMGKCLESDPFLIILEHCAFRDLKTYLMQHRTESESLIQGNLLLRMACNISSGLNHMHLNEFIHTDFATRNCLVGTDLQVKIGDYGNSIEKFKDNYYCAGEVAVPIRWCAPETLRCTESTIETKEVTKEANIWSFGVALWEILEFGKLPYSTLSDEDVLEKVIIEKKATLDQPQASIVHKDQMCQIMKLCWLADPLLRPNMEKINAMLNYLYTHQDTSISSGFEARWCSLQPRISSSTSNTKGSAAATSSLKFDNNFTSSAFHSAQSNVSCEWDASSSPSPLPSLNLENDYSASVANNISPSLQNLRGSLDDLNSSAANRQRQLEEQTCVSEGDLNDIVARVTSSDTKTRSGSEDLLQHHVESQSPRKIQREFEEWLRSQQAKGAEASLMAKEISDAICNLDQALISETSSSDSSNHFTQEKDEKRGDGQIKTDMHEEPHWEQMMEESNSRSSSGPVTELVREKSQSVQDFLKLTVIDSDNSDSDGSPAHALTEADSGVLQSSPKLDTFATEVAGASLTAAIAEASVCPPFCSPVSYVGFSGADVLALTKAPVVSEKLVNGLAEKNTNSISLSFSDVANDQKLHTNNPAVNGEESILTVLSPKSPSENNTDSGDLGVTDTPTDQRNLNFRSILRDDKTTAVSTVSASSNAIFMEESFTTTLNEFNPQGLSSTPLHKTDDTKTPATLRDDLTIGVEQNDTNPDKSGNTWFTALASQDEEQNSSQFFTEVDCSLPPVSDHSTNESLLANFDQTFDSSTNANLKTDDLKITGDVVIFNPEIDAVHVESSTLVTDSTVCLDSSSSLYLPCASNNVTLVDSQNDTVNDSNYPIDTQFFDVVSVPGVIYSEECKEEKEGYSNDLSSSLEPLVERVEDVDSGLTPRSSNTGVEKENEDLFIQTNTEACNTSVQITSTFSSSSIVSENLLSEPSPGEDHNNYIKPETKSSLARDEKNSEAIEAVNNTDFVDSTTEQKINVDLPTNKIKNTELSAEGILCSNVKSEANQVESGVCPKGNLVPSAGSLSSDEECPAEIRNELDGLADVPEVNDSSSENDGSFERAPTPRIEDVPVLDPVIEMNVFSSMESLNEPVTRQPENTEVGAHSESSECGTPPVDLESVSFEFVVADDASCGSLEAAPCNRDEAFKTKTAQDQKEKLVDVIQNESKLERLTGDEEEKIAHSDSESSGLSTSYEIEDIDEALADIESVEDNDEASTISDGSDQHPSFSDETTPNLEDIKAQIADYAEWNESTDASRHHEQLHNFVPLHSTIDEVSEEDETTISSLADAFQHAFTGIVRRMSEVQMEMVSDEEDSSSGIQSASPNIKPNNSSETGFDAEQIANTNCSGLTENTVKLCENSSQKILAVEESDAIHNKLNNTDESPDDFHPEEDGFSTGKSVISVLETANSVTLEDLDSPKSDIDVVTVFPSTKEGADDDILVVDTETNKIVLVEGGRPRPHLAFVRQSTDNNSTWNSKLLDVENSESSSSEDSDDVDCPDDHRQSLPKTGIVWESPFALNSRKIKPGSGDDETSSSGVTVTDIPSDMMNLWGHGSTEPEESEIVNNKDEPSDAVYLNVVPSDDCAPETSSENCVTVEDSNEESHVLSYTIGTEGATELAGSASSPTASSERSPEMCYTPDWESDSESTQSTSSTSGEFDCNKTHANKASSSSCASKKISSAEDDDEDELDEETLKVLQSFQPSEWNKDATPVRGLLKSPEKKSETKKSVSFKMQKRQVIYEYPREEKEKSWEEPKAPVWGGPYDPQFDFANSMDWEFGEDEIPEDIVEVEDFDESSRNYTFSSPVFHLQDDAMYRLSDISVDDEDGNDVVVYDTEAGAIALRQLLEQYGSQMFYGSSQEGDELWNPEELPSSDFLVTSSNDPFKVDSQQFYDAQYFPHFLMNGNRYLSKDESSQQAELGEEEYNANLGHYNLQQEGASENFHYYDPKLGVNMFVGNGDEDSESITCEMLNNNTTIDPVGFRSDNSHPSGQTEPDNSVSGDTDFEKQTTSSEENVRKPLPAENHNSATEITDVNGVLNAKLSNPLQSVNETDATGPSSSVTDVPLNHTDVSNQELFI